MMSFAVIKGAHQINFKARSEEPITEDLAMEAQSKAGYMPQGYGFYDFKVIQKEEGYEATWNCFSCS